MNPLWTWLASGAWGSLVVPLLWSWRGTRYTTLTMAWIWGASAWGLWGLAWCLTMLSGGVTEGWGDQVWYAAALVTVATPITVLGARRPGHTTWGAFVLLPLLAVLGWPALLAIPADLQPERLHLMEPSLVAFTLVAVMGAGNYVPTRWSIAAVGCVVSLWLIVAPLATDRFWFIPSAEGGRVAATLLLPATIWWSVLRRPREPLDSFPLVRLIQDFQNTFGVVWTHRLVARLNEAARHGGWPGHVVPEGGAWRWQTRATVASGDRASPEKLDADTRESVVWMLRVQLRRFVDPPWIDARLPDAWRGGME